MYTTFYKLSGRPFQLSPNYRFFFGSKNHRRTMAYLTYGLHQGEGFIVVTGDVGTGKTTLVDYLSEQLGAERFCTGRLGGSQPEPAGVLSMVAKAFRLPAANASRPDLQTHIETFLVSRQKARQRPLLIVDEVQNWHLPALEELRMLSNLQADGTALLQILLVGQPQFRDALAQPDHEQLRQRVVASHHLDPLDDGEIRAYIEHRLEQVGWNQDPGFDDSAHQAIFEHTDGIPRLINLICSRLLVLGAIEGKHEITAEAVAEVMSELEQEIEPLEATMSEPVSRPVNGSEDELAYWGDLEHWRKEVVRLLRKLETAHEDLSGERTRAERIRAEADRLRSELHRIELERLRVDAETSRRAVEVLAKRSPPGRGALFRRIVRN